MKSTLLRSVWILIDGGPDDHDATLYGVYASRLLAYRALTHRKQQDEYKYQYTVVVRELIHYSAPAR